MEAAIRLFPNCECKVTVTFVMLQERRGFFLKKVDCSGLFGFCALQMRCVQGLGGGGRLPDVVVVPGCGIDGYAVDGNVHQSGAIDEVDGLALVAHELKVVLDEVHGVVGFKGFVYGLIVVELFDERGDVCSLRARLNNRFSNDVFVDVRYIHSFTDTNQHYSGGKNRNIQISLGYLF